MAHLLAMLRILRDRRVEGRGQVDHPIVHVDERFIRDVQSGSEAAYKPYTHVFGSRARWVSTSMDSLIGECEPRPHR